MNVLYTTFDVFSWNINGFFFLFGEDDLNVSYIGVTRFTVTLVNRQIIVG